MIAPLLPEHIADLQKSGLSDATIAAAQIQAVCPRDLQALGSRYQSVSSAYRIPYFDIDGTLSDFHRLKLFPTVTDRNGHTMKYHQPAGTDAGLYRPPLMNWGCIATDTAQPLVITEGEKKALALAQLIPCLGIGGLWSWRAKVDGERMTLPEFATFRWENRRVELAPDSDIWDRLDLLKAVFALAMELVHRSAVVSVVKLPERAGGKVNPLTREEVSLLLTTTKDKLPRYYPLFLCAVRTGLRMGELLALQWGDIDWQSRFLY